jgi:hypothetical protein
MIFVVRTARLDKADVHVCTSVAHVCPFQHQYGIDIMMFSIFGLTSFSFLKVVKI